MRMDEILAVDFSRKQKGPNLSKIKTEILDNTCNAGV
jgi:hypothetical protein